ncbi:DUF6710 family protein [Enterococcus dongliensis]|uniref:DUF6710 family protein n=1 Tax=Enterococcus dongliensis TaxID=2559925 RepID=UPI002892DBC9|nr:DUF6710 family protein [Enterococcus dongliensis]
MANTNEALYSSIIKDAEKILTTSNENKNGLHPIFSFIKQFTDLITAEVAINSYTTRLQSDINTKKILEARYSGYFSSLINHIELSSNREDFQFIDMSNYFYYSEDIIVNLNNFPIILNPWNSDRISLYLVDDVNSTGPINKNTRSIIMNNIFYYPVGIAQCFGGNHPQYSAKLKGGADTYFNSIQDISKLYNFIKFNGKEFKYVNPNILDKLSPRSFVPENEQRVYLGILFEIGRLLLKSPSIFPENIKEAITDCKKI